MSAIIDFLNNNGSDLLIKTWEHLYISVIAAALGVIVAVPLGILLTRFDKAASPVMAVLGMIQTIPSFAILAFLFLFLE